MSINLNGWVIYQRYDESQSGFEVLLKHESTGSYVQASADFMTCFHRREYWSEADKQELLQVFVMDRENGEVKSRVRPLAYEFIHEQLKDRLVLLSNNKGSFEFDCFDCGPLVGSWEYCSTVKKVFPKGSIRRISFQDRRVRECDKIGV